MSWLNGPVNGYARKRAGGRARHIARFELARSTDARGSLASGSSVAIMFPVRAMTLCEKYRAISATIQRIESGLPDMHWLIVLRKISFRLR